MADNLESYFKKNLSDETPAYDQWNVPSDAVWENVSPVIQKKRGLFIPLRYFYLLGGIIFAGLLLLFLWPDSSVKTIPSNQNLQAKIEKANINTPEKTGRGSDAEQDNIPTHSIEEMESASQIAINNSSGSANNATFETIKTTNKKISRSEKAETDSAEESFGQGENGFAIAGNDNIEAGLFSVDDKAHNTIVFVNLKSTTALLSDETIELPKPTTTILLSPVSEAQAKKKEPFDNKGKIGLGAFFAPTLTSTYISGDLHTGEMKAGNMFLYSGNWGFELKYHISNRFAILTGVEKSEIKSWSKSLVDFGYDASTEHNMETGEKENTSPISMPTPFGEIDTEITYRFPGEQQIPDGEIMQSVLETHQEVRYFSIPLGLEFNIIRFSRFSWFTEGGLRYNRALKDATQFSSRIIHQGDEMNVVAEEMTSHPTFTENYLNFYIGTGLNYQFSKSFQINASTRYFGNITHVNLQDNMSTYVQGFSLKIGIVYLF